MSHNSIAQYLTATRTPCLAYDWAVCPAGMPIPADGMKAPLAGFSPKGVISREGVSSREDGGNLRTNRAGPGVQ
jgi:hypothetical protein